MNNNKTISTGARVFIYILSIFFDLFTALIFVYFWLLGLLFAPFGVGFIMPPVAVIFNKFITLIATFVFIIIYNVIGARFKSKLKKFIIKKMFTRFLLPILIKLIPLLGALPMITFGNWLLIMVVDKYDKKMQAEKENNPEVALS